MKGERIRKSEGRRGEGWKVKGEGEGEREGWRVKVLLRYAPRVSFFPSSLE